MRLLSIFAALVAAPAAASTHPLTAADTAAIDRAAADILRRTQVPAASIAIVEGGRIVYARAYGEQAPGVPARTDARYAIASISKQFTATALLMLADRGRLTLDDPVARWEPALTQANRVTVRQLLNHSAGYRDYWPQDYSFAAMADPVTPQAILDRWAKAPLDFAPGTRHQYSNTGYVVAGRIVEKASGQPLMPWLSANILTPLGLASAVDADTGMTAADARPHMRYALGPVRAARPAAPGWLFAAGELAMTASDLARWDIAMIDRRLLSPSGYAAQQAPLVLPDGEATGYGLGIEIDAVDGHRRLHHGGEAVGFLSENRVYPDDRAAIVVLDNADFGDAETAIADRIEAILLARDAAAGDTTRVRALYAALRAGTLDPAQLTADARYYFTPAALADYRASLSALPEPIGIDRLSSGLRGGFTVERYRIRLPGRTLSAVLRAEPGAEGRIEQFSVYPDG
jgi:CubicO group peptidase (beta-lactamase class C family)